jgi:hypothetical protein
MSSHLNNSQRSSVKQRVQKKFNALADVCINEDEMRRDPSKSTNCDEFGEEIIPPPLDVNRAVIPQLLAFYQKVANHWARKNKLNYKATWNYYQAVYACEHIERKYCVEEPGHDQESDHCAFYFDEEGGWQKYNEID